MHFSSELESWLKTDEALNWHWSGDSLKSDPKSLSAILFSSKGDKLGEASVEVELKKDLDREFPCSLS